MWEEYNVNNFINKLIKIYYSMKNQSTNGHSKKKKLKWKKSYTINLKREGN